MCTVISTKIHIAHLFPLNHFLRLSNISILASKSRGWKDSNQRSNTPENVQLTPGHSRSYLNAYISVYLPTGSGRRTNRYIFFSANRNHLSPSYARLKNHTFLLTMLYNRPRCTYFHHKVIVKAILSIVSVAPKKQAGRGGTLIILLSP